MDIPAALGWTGTLLILAAYIPQIRHLVREKCAAGISFITWEAWWLGSVLLAIHALDQKDGAFVAVQTVNLAAVSLTLYYAKKYEGRTCSQCGIPDKAKKNRPNNNKKINPRDL